MPLACAVPRIAACLVLAVCLVSVPAVADDTGEAGYRLAFRLYGGLEDLRTPLVEGIDDRGANLGVGAEYRLSKSYSLLSTAEFRSQGPDDTPELRDGALKLGSVVVSLKVVPFATRARVTPYVTAGIGLLHARWRGSLYDGVRFPTASETAATIPLGLGVSVRPRGPTGLSLFLEGKHEFATTRSLFAYGMEWWGVRVGVSLQR